MNVRPDSDSRAHAQVMAQAQAQTQPRPSPRREIEAFLGQVSASLPTHERMGAVHDAIGTIIRATGVEADVGEVCLLHHPRTQRRMQAQIVGFSGEHAILMPFGDIEGIGPGTEVRPLGHPHLVPVGDALLGRVLDGFGAPIDGRPFAPSGWRPGRAERRDPLARARIARPLVTGIRVIDGLATVGQGQRMGIFAPAGVGKSVLLGMLARQTQCDVRVIALVGERGREVGEFIDLILGPQGLAQSVVVVATSDASAVERATAGHTASAIAEYFAAAGRNVLLLFDSVTRFARAQREIGLAAGEPPARQGFPPSVFSSLPRLVERAGCWDKGSITAFYTVLVEGEVATDPIGEEVRSLLDGHLVLSQKLAHQGHFPAVDPLRSLSRVMPYIADAKHQGAARRMRALLAKYDEIELLVQLGEYKSRTDPDADEALARIGEIRRFLVQGMGEVSSAQATLEGLNRAGGTTA